MRRCIHYPFLCCDKIPRRSHLRGKRLIFARGFNSIVNNGEGMAEFTVAGACNLVPNMNQRAENKARNRTGL